MCGFVGFTQARPGDETLVARMLDSIAYRGPDQSGLHIDDGWAVGHRRLTIIAPSGGTQPCRDATTGDVLVFNGEIYDYRRLAAGLRDDGWLLRDDSDTEVLFCLIRRHGIMGALDRIDGMYAFAYRDGHTGHVTLARDRFGEKPLFYAVVRGRLLFASEIKALLRHPDLADADFDVHAIDQYLAFDYVPAPRTGLSGIRKLPPGHVLHFAGGEAVVERYWHVPRRPGPPLDERSAADQLEAHLDRAIRSRLVADVPVGVFLSGGIDSSLVAALVARNAPAMTAFTVKIGADSYDESPYAAQVAQLYGLRHEITEVGEGEVLAALDTLAARLDEPFADASIVPTYLLCQAARRKVTVALGGDGADELFAGYPNFKVRRVAPLMARIGPAGAAALRRLAGLLPGSGGYMSLEFKVRQVLQGLGHHPDHQPFMWMAPFALADRPGLYSAEAHARLSGADPFAPVTAHLDSLAVEPALLRLQHLFASLYLADDILVKVDRASMYNSLEVRAPFLDVDLAEFALRLPDRLKLRGMTGKHLLKVVARRHLPASLVDRKKHGFALPVADLLRGPLREAVHACLLSPSNPLADWFDRGALERLLASHQSGAADHRKKLWALYQLFRFAENVATVRRNSAP